MREIVARYPLARSAMLPCLHLAQEDEGYITPEGIAVVAEAIGAKPDEVEIRGHVLLDVPSRPRSAVMS